MNTHVCKGTGLSQWTENGAIVSTVLAFPSQLSRATPAKGPQKENPRGVLKHAGRPTLNQQWWNHWTKMNHFRNWSWQTVPANYTVYFFFNSESNEGESIQSYLCLSTSSRRLRNKTVMWCSVSHISISLSSETKQREIHATETMILSLHYISTTVVVIIIIIVSLLNMAVTVNAIGYKNAR